MSSGKSSRVFRSIRNLLTSSNSLIGLAGTPAIRQPSRSIRPVITEPIPTIHLAGMLAPGAIRISEPT